MYPCRLFLFWLTASPSACLSACRRDCLLACLHLSLPAPFLSVAPRLGRYFVLQVNFMILISFSLFSCARAHISVHVHIPPDDLQGHVATTDYIRSAKKEHSAVISRFSCVFTAGESRGLGGRGKIHRADPMHALTGCAVHKVDTAALRRVDCWSRSGVKPDGPVKEVDERQSADIGVVALWTPHYCCAVRLCPTQAA